MEEITCDKSLLAAKLCEPRNAKIIGPLLRPQTALLGQTLLHNPEMKKMGKIHMNIKP